MQQEAYTILESLGLKPNEVQVYLGLLELGPASIRQVAGKTGINRGTTYDCLKQLIDKRLVHFNQKGERRKFTAAHPDTIYDLLEDRRRELVLMQDQARRIVPQIATHTAPEYGQPTVRFYEDDEGIVAILKDILATMIKEEHKTYYVYSSRNLRNYIYRRFPNFTRQRIKAGIKVQVLAIGIGGEIVKLADRKWLPGPNEHTASYIIIYANKVAQISISADDTPYGVIIEEPGVAAMQKYLFEQLWKTIH
jgi:sugar-specific transcriptional regulator TrmB